MSPALRSDGKGHLSRRITLMVLPFDHLSEPDATGDSNREIDSHFHSDTDLEPYLSPVGNPPIAALAGASASSMSIKKSSA
jgi:hypothetical protein